MHHRLRLDSSPTRRAVKFHLSTTAGNVVTGSGAGWVRVGTTEYRENVMLTPDAVAPWAAEGFDGLTEGSMRALLEANPEVVLLGTGRSIRFPPPPLSRILAEARVGVEVMDTGAACRTYNILAGEGRRVVAGLILA
jgi:uncharacterized protein